MDTRHNRGSARDHGVAADMERVFGLAPADESARPLPAASLPAQALPVAKPDPAPKPRRNWLLIAAPVLAVLFVIALAVRFALTLVPANSTAPAEPRRSGAVAYTAAAGRPAAAPVSAPAPELSDEAMTPDAFGPAPVETLPSPPPSPTASAPVAAQPVARARRVAEEDRPRRSNAGDCPPGSHEDRCIYRDVMGADRRLRTAYNRAADYGVPTAELVAVRRRWDRARSISLDEPDETIRRYNQLTDRLDDLSRIAQQ